MHRLKTLLMSGLMAVSGPMSAQTRVYRCHDANGQWVFQGRPCADGLTAPENAAPRTPREPTGRRNEVVPARCESSPQRFLFADPAVDGAEFTLVLSRDASGYQVVLNLGGVIEREDGPVPAQFSPRLGTQGLRFDQGELIAPDFRRGDKQLGYGYARSATLLDRAADALSIDAEIEPQGYAQSLWSAPMAASVLTALRSEVLRCHLLRERARKASEASSEQQASQARSNAEAQHRQ